MWCKTQRKKQDLTDLHKFFDFFKYFINLCYKIILNVINNKPYKLKKLNFLGGKKWFKHIVLNVKQKEEK